MSLRQCMTVLGAYPVIIVKPASLDLAELQQQYPKLDFQSFDDRLFHRCGRLQQINGVHWFFYKTFTAYEYILIYQLDAFVFCDALKEWCAKGYDYIGAPSLHQPAFDSIPATSSQVFATALSTHRVVLNGAFTAKDSRIFALSQNLQHILSILEG